MMLATSIVAATLLAMVVSAGKKADLQRVGMFSSLREISMRRHYVVEIFRVSCRKLLTGTSVYHSPFKSYCHCWSGLLVHRCTTHLLRVIAIVGVVYWYIGVPLIV